jgi:phage/plasmid-like protein (TIGR03299 family)
VQDAPTSSEAIALAGLDYQVVKTPIKTAPFDLRIEDIGVGICVQEIVVPNHFATIRTDSMQPLGIVGRDYQIVQNKDAFSFFDSVAQQHQIVYETAGALGGGERIFITAKLPGHIRVGQDDLIEKYIFLTNSHDGSGSITAAFTPVRIVCQNTLNAAMGNLSAAVRIRHTANAKERLRQAHRIMGLAQKLTQQKEELFNHWAKVRISDKQLKRLIEMAMASSKETLGNVLDGKTDLLSSQYLNTVEDVYQYALGDPCQNLSTTAGTVFGAYNAVTGYFQNKRKYDDNEAKVKSILFGGTAQLRGQRAFELCEGFSLNGNGIFRLN